VKEKEKSPVENIQIFRPGSLLPEKKSKNYRGKVQ